MPPRLDPLPPEHSPELKPEFDSFLKSLGFVPNSVLTMQRRPALVRAFVALQGAIWGPDSKVDRGFKRLIGHVASTAARDPYSMAHTASAAMHFGIDEKKLAAVRDYKSSSLFSSAERAALDLAAAASAIPNAVTDAMFAEAAQALERGADRRDRGRHRRHRLRQPLEHDDGDAARRRAHGGGREASRVPRLVAGPAPAVRLPPYWTCIWQAGRLLVTLEKAHRE